MCCNTNDVKWFLKYCSGLLMLCGLVIVICGVITYVKFQEFSEFEEAIWFYSIIGIVIFTTANFGLYASIQGTQCMLVTFVLLLLSIMGIQVAAMISGYFEHKEIPNKDSRILTIFRDEWKHFLHSEKEQHKKNAHQYLNILGYINVGNFTIECFCIFLSLLMIGLKIYAWRQGKNIA